MKASGSSTNIVQNNQGSIDTSNGVVAYPGMDRSHARVLHLGRHGGKKLLDDATAHWYSNKWVFSYWDERDEGKNGGWTLWHGQAVLAVMRELGQ